MAGRCTSLQMMVLLAKIGTAVTTQECTLGVMAWGGMDQRRLQRWWMQQLASTYGRIDSGRLTAWVTGCPGGDSAGIVRGLIGLTNYGHTRLAHSHTDNWVVSG